LGLKEEIDIKWFAGFSRSLDHHWLPQNVAIVEFAAKKNIRN
jgi:hypothetical protein